jgi:hypothetical protein
MGLFDKFRGEKPVAMTPWLAFAISLVYCIGADGEVDDEEIGFLVTALGGEDKDGRIGVASSKRELLDQAIKYTNKVRPEQFLREAAPVLSREQKLCILANMVDSSLSGGEAEAGEQELIGRFQEGFDIADHELRPIVDVLITKNDRSVLG